MSAVTSASLCLTLLSVCLLFVSADQKIIIAVPGQTVTLPCRAPNSGNPIIAAEWSRADLEQKYVLFYRDDKLDTEEQHPSFKNRVDLQDRQMKDGGVSLILKDVTTADGGTYECCVVHEVREGRKLAVLKTEPISVIQLKVISPGQPGGHGEDGAVGLTVVIVLSIVLFATIIYYIKMTENTEGEKNSTSQTSSKLKRSTRVTRPTFRSKKTDALKTDVSSQ
ncbi:programmed cell death 1 ligand 1-like [Neolamprologus brichardi]|uniref:programmed cell death 1 ligand 1-like n=1 Tax=Neolamprologus brichardi TaxID=32507 RepID=UPI00164398F4|nr:programmed cell death 1 ligand 1-like [Neolamprologus brichardi]XP_035772204.1 programmed cell death 1 ligand 1-like [Neolamprologus brichardi]